MPISALGRLDACEFDAAVGDRVPISVALELGHVDAEDRIGRLPEKTLREKSRSDSSGRRRNPR